MTSCPSVRFCHPSIMGAPKVESKYCQEWDTSRSRGAGNDEKVSPPHCPQPNQVWDREQIWCILVSQPQNTSSGKIAQQAIKKFFGLFCLLPILWLSAKKPEHPGYLGCTAHTFIAWILCVRHRSAPCVEFCRFPFAQQTLFLQLFWLLGIFVVFIFHLQRPKLNTTD